MTEPEPKPTATRSGPRRAVLAFVAAVVLAGAVGTLITAWQQPPQLNLALLIFTLGALALAPHSLRLGGRVEMLASEPFLFAALLANGPTDATLIAGLTALTFCLLRSRRLPLVRVLFNVTSIMLTTLAAARSTF